MSAWALCQSELDAVAQREALEEGSGEESDGCLEVGGPGVLGGERPKAVDVDLEARTAAQRDAVAGRLDMAFADRAANCRERAPQRAPRAGRVVLGPQQIAQRLTRARPIAQREVRDQRQRLARVQDHRHAVARDRRDTEQRDQNRHPRSP